MKKLLFALLFTTLSFSQSITVDNTATPTGLVNMLIGGSCIEVNDIVVSSNQSVGSFNKNGSTFPINEGVIIRSGNILNTQGQYNGLNISTTATGGGTDAFLQGLSNTSSGSTAALEDLAFLQFDFIPVSSSFSFDFLFASNEYGAEQCRSNDIFAFVLTNLTDGSVQNLGVIPSTSTPVSVKTIKNQTYNPIIPSQCTSTNPSLFSVYNVANPAASTINMNGHTVVLNASSPVNPGTEYRLKLVIADWGDTNFDSSVFISGGSFTNNLDLGLDKIICTGNTQILNTQLDASYNHQWFQDGNPVGTNTSTFTVNTPGTYSVTVTKGSCTLTDEIIFNTLAVTNPNNIPTCNTGATSYIFNLTANDEVQLGVNNTTYDLYYYTSPANATANIPITSPANFSTSPAGQTIYLKIFNTLTNQFCDAVYTFNLLVNASVNATTPTNQSLCINDPAFDLTTLTSEVLNLQTGYSVLYYIFQSDAIAGNGATISTIAPLTSAGTQVIWIRMQDQANATCFAITSVTITTNPLPLADTILPVIACSSHVLGALTNGNYFTGPNGTGTSLFAGNTIIDSGTYYVYNGPDANGCSNQTTFRVDLIDEYTPVLDNCGFFRIPPAPNNIGAFYTALGGPTGTGTMIPQDTEYVNTTQLNMVQTIYYYAEVNGVFCRDERFDINIHPLPFVDDPADETHCNSYTLPVLINGNYFSGSGGTGTAYFAGDPITASQTMWVYNTNTYIDVLGNLGACSDQNDFQINIVDTSLFTDIYACESYTLPAITFGGYYTLPGGLLTPAQTQINPNIPITASQTIYYHTNTSILPNCTDNLNYNITIYQNPLVQTIPSTTECGSFTLPILSNGNYYTLSGGPTTLGQTALSAGQIIGLYAGNLAPGTYYIYSETVNNHPFPATTSTTCFSETNFTIGITAIPIINVPINEDICDKIRIPVQPLGQVYTAPNGPNGTGNLVLPTDEFTEDTTFYLYYQDPITGCKVDESFTKYYVGINLPNYPPVVRCDTYTLPILTHIPPEAYTNYTIGYFYDAAGTLPVTTGEVFTATNTPVSVFVVAKNVSRFNTCTEFDEIVITVSATPVITPIVFPASACGIYVLTTLPTAATLGYTIGYFTSPNGVGPITNLNIVNNTGTPGNPTAAPRTETYYVYATATNNVACNDEQAFTFTVYPLFNLPLQGGTICINPITGELIDSYTIQTGLNPLEYTVEWYLNSVLVGTGVNYTALEEGTYDVKFIKLTPNIGAACGYNDTTVTILKSSPAAATFTVSSEFNTDTTFITVNISSGSLGNYEYQLIYPDGSTSDFQTSNTFTNLDNGQYFVNIYDTLGNCSPTQVGPIYIVNYPNYFTPNGDGVNETWNITNLKSQSNAIISIFDRYGKLLKQISPTGLGWDGKYNGKDVPSTDYWFSVEFTNQSNQKSVFKSHFSLKR